MENNKKEVQSEIIIYQTEDGNTKIDVKFQDETVWLTQTVLIKYDAASLAERTINPSTKSVLLAEEKILYIQENTG